MEGPVSGERRAQERDVPQIKTGKFDKELFRLIQYLLNDYSVVITFLSCRGVLVKSEN